MMDEQIQKELTAKLDPKHIVTPTDKFGPKGDYIQGWHAIAEANRIFGHDGWAYEIINLSPCHDPYQNDNKNWCVGYVCTISVVALDTRRMDVGYGSGASKQIGDAHEGAVKEAVTDALKRALRTFGNPFGLALYDKTRQNVGPPQGAQQETAKSDARPIYTALQEALRKFDETTSLEIFDEWKENQRSQITSLPKDWKNELASEINAMRETITAKAAQNMIGA